jgi:hypothetical protein
MARVLMALGHLSFSFCASEAALRRTGWPVKLGGFVQSVKLTRLPGSVIRPRGCSAATRGSFPTQKVSLGGVTQRLQHQTRCGASCPNIEKTVQAAQR